MSDTSTEVRATGRDDAHGTHPTLAALCAGAAAVHFAMVPAHAGDSLVHGLGFAVAGWAQAVAAVALATRGGRRALAGAAAVNVAVLAGWVLSRTAGLPGGGHPWEAESVTIVDGLTSAMELGVVLGALALLARRTLPARSSAPLPATALASLVVMVATTAALASPDARGHDHGEVVLAADGTVVDDGHDHDHGASTTPALDARERCDLGFNPTIYLQEAATAGVDTLTGAGGGHHDHGGDDLTREELEATTGELEAAKLIVDLSSATDAEYQEWLASLDPDRRDGAVDDTGSGGHLGPQPWVAMLDAEQCAQLEEEIAIARDVVLRYPTAADAVEAGWQLVTPYVPGIAAHYMRFEYVDDEFDPAEPEMILFDGNGPDANAIGLSYYVLHDGDEEPAVGFTGDNDHYHRHVGLCIGAGGVVIGDTTTPRETCEAMGGRKADGGNGWMSHAWVMPGCESPWGLFSAVNPLLDWELTNSSGQGEPCSGSGVLDRYGMEPPPAS